MAAQTIDDFCRDIPALPVHENTSRLINRFTGLNFGKDGIPMLDPKPSGFPFPTIRGLSGNGDYGAAIVRAYAVMLYDISRRFKIEGEGRFQHNKLSLEEKTRQAMARLIAEQRNPNILICPVQSYVQTGEKEFDDEFLGSWKFHLDVVSSLIVIWLHPEILDDGLDICCLGTSFNSGNLRERPSRFWISKGGMSLYRANTRPGRKKVLVGCLENFEQQELPLPKFEPQQERSFSVVQRQSA